jgi:alpha-L-fucosidase 2
MGGINVDVILVEGALGASAGITEMIVQSHEGVIDLLPALPNEWSSGEFEGVCVRGGFELNIAWKDKKITSLEIKSKAGNTCKILAEGNFKVLGDKTEIKTKKNKDGSLQFETTEGKSYQIIEIK